MVRDGFDADRLVYPKAINVENKIYIFGGWDGRQTLTNSDLYIPARDKPSDQAWFLSSSDPGRRPPVSLRMCLDTTPPSVSRALPIVRPGRAPVSFQ